MTPRLAISFFAVCFAVSGLAAPESVDRIRENEQRQQELSAETRKLVAALDAVLGEYARNQIAGEDVTFVQKLRGSIERLSAAEMRQVIDLLQQARAVQDTGVGARTVADAFSAQKQIVVSIQRILAEHGRRQQAQEFARQINDLADRQARNLKDGIELGRLAGTEQPESFEAVRLAQLEIQRGEQAAIAAELKVVTENVQRFANDPRNADVVDRFRPSVAQLRQVQPRADAAEAALAAGQIFKAVGEEKINRDELRKIARIMAPREQGPDALRQAERELAQLIREQESLMTETARQRKDTDFEKWIAERIADIDPNRTLEGQFRRLTPEQRLQSPELRAKFDAEQTAKATELARMEDDQGELSMKTDDLSQTLADIPAADAALRQATAVMQEARNAMQEADAQAAQQRQGQAVARMQVAHEEVRKKADEAELLAANSGDKVRDLERLRAAVENLAKEEEAISKAGQPNATQQADVARRATQLGQRSRELAPTATPALQQGAALAEQSRASIAQNQNEPARQQAGQAAQQLAQAARQIAQAARQIAQELANAQAAAEQRERAQAALAQLAKLIEAEQTLDLETARATSVGKVDSVRQLAGEQAAIEQRTTVFKSSLSGEMIASIQSLNDAENAMQLAAEALRKADGAEARKMEALAIARLFDTQKSINASADPARQALDEKFADASAMAHAANKLTQAMQEVNEAQATLQKAAEQMGQQTAQSAAEAARQAANTARESARAAQAAGQQAGRASNQAAVQRAENAAQLAQQAAQAATQAVQSAEAMANEQGAAAVQRAQQTAEQAGQAAQAASQATTAANQAQRAANAAASSASENQVAAQQAAASAQSAQTAAEAARRAQQLARTASERAQKNAQAAGQSMQQAASQLSQAAVQAGQAAAQQAGSPNMQQALQKAAQELANAAAQAMNGQNAAAQSTAQQAAQQLAEASGMSEAAQAGIGQPSAGQMAGQGQQGAMPGQGMQGAGRQPGQGQGSGPTKDTNQPSEGATGYQAGSPEAVQRAARQAAIKQAGFLGLPPRERAAIQQSLGEKYPQEFGPLVEQYLLNLANEPARK